MMVSMSSLHTLTAELHTGFLVLAFIGIAGAFLMQIVVWGKGPKSLLPFAQRSRGYLEAAGIVGAILGVMALVLSAITGALSFPVDLLLDTPEALNKILLTAAATTIWAGVAYIRLCLGKAIWASPSMSTLYAGLALIGFVLVSATGSMGAHITKGESILDPVWNLLGIDPTQSWLVSNYLAILAIVGSVAIIIGCVAFAWRMGICKKWFMDRVKEGGYWDEPWIRE